MIRQIKQKEWLKNKNKILYFWNILLRYTVWSREIISDNIKKQQVVIYITFIANVRP